MVSGMSDVSEETLIFASPESGRDAVRSTWEAVSSYIEQQLDQGKPVTIPQFGKFTFLVKGGGAKTPQVLEPVFVFNEGFMRQNGLRARSIPRGALMPQTTELNYAAVASLCGQSKDRLMDSMKQMMRGLGSAMADSAVDGKTRVRANVYNVGKICCNQGMVKFAFAPKWGCTRPGTNETCRTSFSRSSAASRAGSVLGGREGTASSREMNAAMSNAVKASKSAAPRSGYGNSELATIEELRANDDAANDEDLGRPASSTPEENVAAEPVRPASSLVDSVMNDEQWNGDFNEDDVEELMQREQEQARQTESMMSSGGASDVLPVYLCPEMTRSSRRIQRQKDIVAKALKSAYTRFDDTLQQDLRRVSKENQLFEAELRRQTQAANELRAWRKSNLLEQRRMHETQMQVGQKREAAAREQRNAPVVGYIDSRQYIDDGRQKILDPHQKTLSRTLQSQVETKKIMHEEEKAEVTEYEQLQNELLMQDMELRQSYVREANINEGTTLRAAWDMQQQCKRKVDVVKKINDDIITNVLPPFEASQRASWLPAI